MSNKLYDILKWIAQILLPAIGALYFGLADYWNLPKVTEIVGSITVVDVFLGALLGLSARAYNKSPDRFDGVLDLRVDGDATEAFMLKLTKDPLTIADQDTFTVQVRNQ